MASITNTVDLGCLIVEARCCEFAAAAHIVKRDLAIVLTGKLLAPMRDFAAEVEDGLAGLQSHRRFAGERMTEMDRPEVVRVQMHGHTDLAGRPVSMRREGLSVRIGACIAERREQRRTRSFGDVRYLLEQ